MTTSPLFHERLDVGGWDQPNVMAKLADLTTPEMSAAAGFHRHDAGRELAEKLKHLCAPQLLAQDLTTTAFGPVHLKHILRQIEPDCDNLRHDRSPVWIVETHLGTLMPSGGGYIIKAVGTADIQEQSKTHEIVSRSKIELWHQILTHYLPLYLPETERFHRSSRTDCFLAFLEEDPSPHMISAMSREAFVADAWDGIGQKVYKERLLSDIYVTALGSVGLPIHSDSDAVRMFRLVLAEGRSVIRQLDVIEARPSARGSGGLHRHNGTQRHDFRWEREAAPPMNALPSDSPFLIGRLDQARFPSLYEIIVAHPGHASLRSLGDVG